MIEASFFLEYPGFYLKADLRLPEKGVTALFGHSGSGKTTLLRCFSGLIRAPQGRLIIGNEVWQDEAASVFLPTHRRSLGLVFQEASLFPHLSVKKNLEYGMKRAKGRPGKDFTACIELLGISHLLGREPWQLSGGERQRVAVARALLPCPRILLMDEPLASLDLKRKLDILPYLEKLRGELDIPILYISHAPDEIARLADYLVILEEGQVLASGNLVETLSRVDLPPIFADDAGVVLETTVTGHEKDGLTHLGFPGGGLFVPRQDKVPGSALRCRIHASDVSLSLSEHHDSSILNVLPATVETFAGTGVSGHLLVRLLLAGGVPLLSRISERSREALKIAPGLKVFAQIKSAALLL